MIENYSNLMYQNLATQRMAQQQSSPNSNQHQQSSRPPQEKGNGGPSWCWWCEGGKRDVSDSGYTIAIPSVISDILYQPVKLYFDWFFVVEDFWFHLDVRLNQKNELIYIFTNQNTILACIRLSEQDTSNYICIIPIIFIEIQCN